MKCAICNEETIGEELMCFSYRAYIQFLSILGITDCGVEDIAKNEKNSPVYLCEGCLLRRSYAYSNK